MIVDTSAVLAVIFAEPGYDEIVIALAAKSGAAMGAPSVTEAAMVLDSRLGPKAPGLIERFLAEFEIAVVPFTEAHIQAAVAAFTRYGKGRHRAGLNFGDCMSYAVAKLADGPLLYVGEDFSHTDIAPAL